MQGLIFGRFPNGWESVLALQIRPPQTFSKSLNYTAAI